MGLKITVIGRGKEYFLERKFEGIVNKIGLRKSIHLTVDYNDNRRETRPRIIDQTRSNNSKRKAIEKREHGKLRDILESNMRDYWEDYFQDMDEREFLMAIKKIRGW